MTDGERISIIAYVRERFDSQDEKLDGIVERLEALESDRDKREGRDSFLARAGKLSAGVITAAAAAVGAFLGLKNNL